MIHTSQLTAFRCQHQRLVNEHSCLHVQYLQVPTKLLFFFSPSLLHSLTVPPLSSYISAPHSLVFFLLFFFLLCLSRRGQISEDISHGSQHCPILWSIWQREGEGRMSRSLFFPVCWVWLLLSSALLEVSNSETFMWCSEEESKSGNDGKEQHFSSLFKNRMTQTQRLRKDLRYWAGRRRFCHLLSTRISKVKSGNVAYI